MTCRELWEISLGPTPLSIAASVCARTRMCTHVQGSESTVRECQPRHLPAACLMLDGEEEQQHQETNANALRSVDRSLIVATCGKVHNNNI